MTHDFDRLFQELLTATSAQARWKIDRLGAWKTFEMRTEQGAFLMNWRLHVHQRDLRFRRSPPRLVDRRPEDLAPPEYICPKGEPECAGRFARIDVQRAKGG